MPICRLCHGYRHLCEGGSEKVGPTRGSPSEHVAADERRRALISRAFLRAEAAHASGMVVWRTARCRKLIGDDESTR